MRGWHLHLLSLAFVVYCLGLWIRAKTIDQSQRGHAERRALYVALWPPTLWVIGDAIERYESRPQGISSPARDRKSDNYRDSKVWLIAHG
jgi:hypothetical protein